MIFNFVPLRLGGLEKSATEIAEKIIYVGWIITHLSKTVTF